MHFKVGAICKEVQDETGIVFSKAAIASIAELAFRQTGVFAEDLEAFAKHGRRKKVGTEDVLLLARRSKSLVEHLRAVNDDKKK